MLVQLVVLLVQLVVLPVQRRTRARARSEGIQCSARKGGGNFSGSDESSTALQNLQVQLVLLRAQRGTRARASSARHSVLGAPRRAASRAATVVAIAAATARNRAARHSLNDLKYVT